MEHEEQYKSLLLSNRSENNLLVLEMLQSQHGWDLSRALIWIWEQLIIGRAIVEDDWDIELGAVVVRFQLRYTLQEHYVANYTSFYRVDVLCSVYHDDKKELEFSKKNIGEVEHDEALSLNIYRKHLSAMLNALVQRGKTIFEQI